MPRKPNTPDPKAKREAAEDDHELFRAELADVRPLKAEPRAALPRRRPAVRTPRPGDNEGHAPDDLLDDAPSPSGADDPEAPNWARPGVQRRVLQRLRRGQYPVQDSIDLHHLDAVAARRVLLEFLADAVQRGLSCVKVVHGKGLRSRDGPRLKPMATGLLRRHRAVVAYTACSPTDGGTGATQVLLRGSRER